MVEQTDEKNAPRLYRLHRASLIVMWLALGGLAGANLSLRVFDEKVLTRGGVTHALRTGGLGWPWGWQHRSVTEVNLADNSIVYETSAGFDETPIEWAPLAGDIAVSVALAGVAVLICEGISRRGRKRNFATERDDAPSIPDRDIAFSRRRVMVVIASVLLLAVAARMGYVGLHELLRLQSGEKNIVLCNLDVHLNHTESILTVGNDARKFVSFHFAVGALLAMAALLALRRRFTFKELFFSSLLVAVIGSAPLMIPTRAPTTAYMTILLNTPPSGQAIDAMRVRLQPDVVLSKMPPALRASLAFTNTPPIQQCKLDAPMAFDKTVYPSMTLVFDPSLTPTQIETLVDYYWHYYRTLTLESTTESIPSSIVPYENLTKSRWSKAYEAEWDAEWKRAKAEPLTAVAREAPTP